MTQEEFLAKIHAINGFQNAVVQLIVVDTKTRTCSVSLVTDQPYTEEGVCEVEDVVRCIVPSSLRAIVKVQKQVADPELIRKKILEYLDHHHRAAAACIRAEDIEVTLGEPVVFSFGVDAAERGFFEKNEFLMAGIESMLSHHFCNTFQGKLAEKEKGEIFEEDAQEEDITSNYRPVRSFPIANFEAIDEASVPKIATYIADCNFQSNSLTICGSIEYIQERTTKPKTGASGEVIKEGRPYLRFIISDTTGKLTFSYFPKKRTEEKIRALREGDSIVCTGSNELFNGRLSFTAKFINRGSPPPNFSPEKRVGKAIPLHYSKIFPEKLTDYNQMNFFEQSFLPDDLVRNCFVVFDLETTGLDCAPESGKVDAITEIGAVKILQGEICEKFTTLVNPERKLTEEIIALTGITDDMLQDAPKIGEVIPDFFKFCEGCYLVGHNVQFDYKFIKYYALREEFDFDFKTFDTMNLAKSLLFLSNYKLNTLAEYYHIAFNHHRAWDDALTTAKIFIELIKAKKCLPNV